MEPRGETSGEKGGSVRFLLDLPAYLLFMCGALRVLVYPVTRGGAWPWSPPYSWNSQPLVGMTALQALTFGILGVAWLRWVRPAIAGSLTSILAKRRLRLVLTALSVTALLLLALLWFRERFAPPLAPMPAVQTPSLPTSTPLIPLEPPPSLPAVSPSVIVEVPTLEELARSQDIASAVSVIDIYVNIAHKEFWDLDPDGKDRLCTAGKEIRGSMKAHGNTIADLNHTERAIYDLTAPRGRCKQ
jgi:hypothetical protein